MINCRKLGGTAVHGYLHMQDEEALAQVRSCISEFDCAAVASIKHDPRRQSSLLARGLANYLVGLLGKKTAERLNKTSTGRPEFVDDSNEHVAYTSLAHSHDIVAAAVDTEFAVGIDVEFCHDKRDYRRISERIFPAHVTALIQSADSFYQAWCLYEAWGKANDLQHIDNQKNGELMQLLVAWLSGSAQAKQQELTVTMFKPAALYAGCVYRAANGGQYAKQTYDT